jgi:hypothetical protein
MDIDDAKQRDALHAAEQRTFEMIADGASLPHVLNQLCDSIDVQVAPSVTTILLMDADGTRLWQGGGTHAPHEWIEAVIPLPVAYDAGLCGTAAFLKERGDRFDDTQGHLFVRLGIRTPHECRCRGDEPVHHHCSRQRSVTSQTEIATQVGSSGNSVGAMCVAKSLKTRTGRGM